MKQMQTVQYTEVEHTTLLKHHGHVLSALHNDQIRLSSDFIANKMQT